MCRGGGRLWLLRRLLCGSSRSASGRLGGGLFRLGGTGVRRRGRGRSAQSGRSSLVLVRKLLQLRYLLLVELPLLGKLSQLAHVRDEHLRDFLA
jgi:hypothetical protein